MSSSVLGKSAGFAWRAAIRRAIAALETLDDSRLRERADDLLDVESHVLLALAGEARPMTIPLPERAVLIADDLLPSELTALDAKRLVAICLARGGVTSHVAILAAAMEIPMLVGLGRAIRDVADGTTVIVDADRGTLETAPTAAAVAQAQMQADVAAHAARQGTSRSTKGVPRARRHPHRSIREPGQSRRMRRRRSPTAPRVAACCAPSSCSSIGRRRRTRTSSSRPTRALPRRSEPGR